MLVCKKIAVIDGPNIEALIRTLSPLAIQCLHNHMRRSRLITYLPLITTRVQRRNRHSLGKEVEVVELFIK